MRKIRIRIRLCCEMRKKTFLIKLSRGKLQIARLRDCNYAKRHLKSVDYFADAERVRNSGGIIINNENGEICFPANFLQSGSTRHLSNAFDIFRL